MRKAYVLRCYLLTALGTGVTLAASSDASAALTFNFSRDAATSVSDFNTILPHFQAAGDLWSDIFDDNMTVNIRVGYRNLGTGVLGQASSESISAAYSSTRTALIGDATSTDDTMATSNLPAGPSLSFFTNNEATGAREFDNNNSNNNNFLDLNRANAKALGLLSGTDTSEDAFIEFSSAFSWDFNRSNGINFSQFDFVAVAAHEIGHALGFVSGVDTVDFASEPNGPVAPTELDNFRVFSALDLFRYSDASGVLDLAYGGTPYFSIDAGVTNLGLFATGSDNGDGDQASHWKDDLGLGLMDPTLANGTLGNISDLDVRALDVIGYNLIPEPTAIAMLSVGALVLLRRHSA